MSNSNANIYFRLFASDGALSSPIPFHRPSFHQLIASKGCRSSFATPASQVDTQQLVSRLSTTVRLNVSLSVTVILSVHKSCNYFRSRYSVIKMPTKKAATKKKSTNSSTAIPAPSECSQQPPAQLHKRSRSDQRYRAMPMTSPFVPEFDFNRPVFHGAYDPFASHLPTPAFGPAPYGQFPPYEVDIKTERQLFVNDVPTRCDTSFSSFTTYAPPQLHATLPPFPGDEWIPEASLAHPPPFVGMEAAAYEQNNEQSYSLMQTSIPVDDADRPLLNYFVDKVLRLSFPILEVHQRGHERAQAIFHSLETNKSYLHCCLSVAAIHLKNTAGVVGEEIDYDIVRHRYEAVSQLYRSLNENTNYDQALDTTLAMIFFNCSVCDPEDYHLPNVDLPGDIDLPDIAWSDHFQAVTSLVERLDLPSQLIKCDSPFTQPPFNMTLTAWIDILGATMLGKSPHFAHTYRTKHLSGTSSGLRELMGCDDRVMYLISEIACLDALKKEGVVDDMAVCSHVSALGRQLEFTEPLDPKLESPFSPDSGAIRPDQLTKNMTAIFRIAARIYLCSLVPGFDRSQQNILNLVDAVTHALQFIPGGPDGYDRSLVWPLLITGAFSMPSSSFRQVLRERVVALGDQADFGSFGRMYRVLQEVWKLADDPVDGGPTSPPIDPAVKRDTSTSPPCGTPGMREIRKRGVHWRDVMIKNDWRYLLI
ncbi:C6 sexual development transcription factor NosA [Rasamsonia emersonii CBS 393.64]|uniref:C6 sexual development transcription factor NosA n=1 Tax=Rasamsonia emersonii (strain ATCC 16479 / CBS 393.64 / IMI 116815) TaxID=1408163 RepID=A0A0F4Z4Y7_RASE3|nr:C6 sexual development transcription factor NosA [Rasamsonia emersonii CBS 393.64]KKA25131.1 C6 sexual development transcription factor NosA [Rasamsonia emersonii CBS 393.64]